ncbi:hypothetical protein DXG03_004946 [Asterophora parasitica]|uniref:Uncharacterized protein n=1 Tax=Asterophora parasitica TaxID=117018 RepID=A0A9P7KG93_9AGAR|nr:hypothetical protein DXG03_004946 [Asterophora parasitica]
MEDHIMKECTVMTGKSERARTMPICARGNCKKVLFQPIRCDAASTSRPGVSNLLAGVNTKNLNAKASAASAATMGAIKKATTATATTPASRPVQVAKPAPAKPATPSSHAIPFSKTDRRAKAERESRLKAMQARAKKGLLSEEEKAILAAEEKEAAEKKDCVVM